MRRDEAHALAGLIALFVITSAWWALALWPVADGPAWLERTRYVCFGVTATGLPDAGGWIGLTAGPLGMLSILLIGWFDGVRGLLRRARTSRVVAATLIVLALGCTTMVTGAAVRVQQARVVVGWADATALPADSYPRLDLPSPALALTGQGGEAVDLADFAGRPALVTFAYAHCSTICPVIVMDALQAQAALRGTADEPVVLIVTLDPWRDTPSRLPSMAKSWGLPETGAWVLSGDVDRVETVLDTWDVPRSRNTTTGDVTHPSLIYVIGRDGRIAFASAGRADALVSLIRRL